VELTLVKRESSPEVSKRSTSAERHFALRLRGILRRKGKPGDMATCEHAFRVWEIE
jgi:hypothetical protein